MSEEITKGVFAKNAAEAKDRAKKVGLSGDITVKPTNYITGNEDTAEVRAWSVTGKKKEEE